MAAEAPAAIAEAAVEAKWVCGEGDDCPCHHTERKLPSHPTLGSRKVSSNVATPSQGTRVHLCCLRRL